MIWNCLPIWIVCALITLGFFKAPALTQRILKAFGRFLQSLCMLLFAVTVILLYVNPRSILGDLRDSMSIFIKMLIIVMGGTVLSTLIQRCMKPNFAMSVFHINAASFSGMLLNSISSIAMSPLWPQMDPRGKRVNAAFAVSGAYLFGGQMTFAVASGSRDVLLAYFASKITAGALGIMIALAQEKAGSKSSCEN